jgi:hypothetical protein
MQKEFDKLNLEIIHARRFQLNYLNYKFYLDFINIRIDPVTKSSVVNVTEGRDVIFEISSPVTSKFRNIQHTISLQKEKNSWKITSDQYDDALWRILRTTSMSLLEFQNAMTETKQPMTTQTISTNQESTMSIQSDGAYSVRAYDGLGAAEYADYWYDRINPAYYNFHPLGGDCTNFVSQAMYEKNSNGIPYGVYPYGGNSIMTSVCDLKGNCDGGWYYVSLTYRAPAWTGVGQLFEFLVTYKDNWNAGPFGEEVFPDITNNNFQGLYLGDIIQYDWEPDKTYNHSVIIDGFINQIPLVASHSDFFRDAPYTYNLYTYPNEKVRFIHIQGIKIPHYHLPIILRDYSQSDSVTVNPTPSQNSSNLRTFAGYPAPNQNISAQPNQAYPAP